MSIVSDWRERGLLHQESEGALRWLGGSEEGGVYCGVDPTGPSLHVGHLLPLLALKRLAEAGREAVVLIGSATAFVGDPSGRVRARPILEDGEIKKNAESIKGQITKLMDVAPVKFADNIEWFGGMGLLEFLRGAGKDATLTSMLGRESVKARMDTGISFMEFSYSLLQGWDMVELNRRFGVIAQIGGSDQWGNITAGLEMLRKHEGVLGHGLTVPLMLDERGQKIGKSEGMPIWLDEKLTTPLKFFQFWLNTPDSLVMGFLKQLTGLGKGEIEELAERQKTKPEDRSAARRLAGVMTEMIHGQKMALVAERVSAVMFGKTGIDQLSEAEQVVLDAEMPFVEADGVIIKDFFDILVAGGLCSSKSQARTNMKQKGVRVNGQVVTDPSLAPWVGKKIIISKGARGRVVVRWAKGIVVAPVVQKTNSGLTP